ncbi:MAG: hypothetical protein ABJ015_03510, partial [Rhodopirellula bahusiensis]
MSKKMFQVSIRGLFIVALVIAAYLAGRVPWERAAKSSISNVVSLDRRNTQVSLYAAVWREIALEARDDLRMSGLEWDMHSAGLLGHGGSFVGSRNSEEIVPRAKRWEFALSSDVEIGAKQLEAIGAFAVCVWDDPARIERWDVLASRFCRIELDERPEQWLIMAGNEELFAMLPDTVLDEEPRFVFLTIPNDAENALAMAELQQIRQRNITVQEVARTSFGFVGIGETLEPTV